MRKIIAFIILAAFIAQTCVPYAHAQQAVNLPNAGMRLELSPAFAPPLLKGVKVYTKDPFRLDFILDRGDNAAAKDDANRLIKYFLAALTVPEEDLWVNLSPYEKDRIVPEAFGQTEMGRDLLAQDYILKQVTASLLYPEGEVGKKFWAKIYAQAQEQFGTTEIPVDTFNKVWIVPEKATVYENKDAAFVVESRLKVMLESDYLAMDHNSVGAASGRPIDTNTQEMTKNIIREVIIPILEKEVNEGKNFAQLRQVYYSLILATWFKDKILGAQLSLLPTGGHVAPFASVSPSRLPSELALNVKAPEGSSPTTNASPLLSYINRQKIAGVDIADKAEKEKIWAQYVEAFKKGVFNFVKEEKDAVSGEIIPRKYFSGGAGLQIKAKGVYLKTNEASRLPKDFSMDHSEIVEMKGEPGGSDTKVDSIYQEEVSHVRVVYGDGMNEEDVVSFSKLKYGSGEMIRRFGYDLARKVHQEFGVQIQQDPDNWVVVSVGGGRFLGEYVARELGIHASYVRVESSHLVHIPNYAAANDLKSRLGIVNERSFVLENDRRLKAKNVILVDDLLNRGVTLRSTREFLETKHALNVVGEYVLFSIAKTVDASLESRLNTAFVDAQGIEALIRMVNGEDVFVTRHLLKQLFYEKDRIHNILALDLDKQRQVVSKAFGYVFASTSTLVRMKTDLLYRNIKAR